MRILFLGKRWFGSCARACCAALRRSGHSVVDISEEDYELAGATGRIVAKVVGPICLREYNRKILTTARTFNPDFVLAFKGAGVAAPTLRTLREWGFRTYNYFPDALLIDKQLIKALPEYDCVFDTKRSSGTGVTAHLQVRERVVVPHGYDPDLHHPVRLDEWELLRYGCDVGYVGNHAPRKEALLLELVKLRPALNLRLWGHRWMTADSRLRRFVAGPAIEGAEYSRAISAPLISLGIMGYNDHVMDETSTRTFEIPACGSFMLHERTPEVLRLFEEGKEIECFGSPEEMAAKIDYYLAHPEERAAIASRGYKRCVPAYSYDSRVEQIVSWHVNRTELCKNIEAGVNE